MRKSILKIFFVAIMLFLIPASYAKADDTMYVKNKFKETVICSKYDQKNDQSYSFYMDDLPYDAKKVKIKSSNKAVAKVKGTGRNYFHLYPQKAGITKITITAVVNGKTVKKTGTVKVVNFQIPFKSLKVDGKNYVSKIRGKYNYITIKTNKSKVKLSYKLQSGWKVVKSFDGKYVKSGKTYSIKKGVPLTLYLGTQNKKSGAVITTFIEIQR